MGSYGTTAGQYAQDDAGPATMHSAQEYDNPFNDDAMMVRRRRYKFHGRGDGMYDAARQLGEQPHLVVTGRHAGRSNVKYVGGYNVKWDPHLWYKDFFTSIASVRLAWLFLWMLVAYFLTYLFWAVVWYIVYKTAPQCVSGLESNFISAYLFSLELQATIGFGVRASGVCASTAIFSTLQNVGGMILDAVSLGIIFAKLSHPRHRGRSIFISECATIARRDGMLKFMFRIADIRNITACDARVRAYLYTWGAGRHSLEGERMPVRVEPMQLSDIDGMLLLPTVMDHPIDERSPLFNLSHDDLLALHAEIVVTFEAVTDFGDSFMVRQSYLASEVHWGSVFVPIVHRAGPGSLQHLVDLSRFHDIMPQARLPRLPPGALSRHVLAGGVQPLPFPKLGDNTLVLSDCCTITRRDGAPHLLFRVADTRPGQMVEVTVRAYLYEWRAIETREGENVPYSSKEVEVGYLDGTDRLLLRFPQTVHHRITADSPLARWADPAAAGALPPAEIVVVVEATMYLSSDKMMRTVTYKLPGQLKHGHYFAPMVSRGVHEAAVPAVDWANFHAVLPAGAKPQAARRVNVWSGVKEGSANLAAQGSTALAGGPSNGGVPHESLELASLHRPRSQGSPLARRSPRPLASPTGPGSPRV